MQKTVEQLGKLFGSTAQVKVMRLLLQSPDVAFPVTDVMERTKVSRTEFRKAINSLKSVGFLSEQKVTIKSKLKNGKTQTKKVAAISLKKTYPLTEQLYTLLITCGLITPDEVHGIFSRLGKVHLLVMSGHFMQDADRMLDLLIIGDRLNPRQLERAVKTLESEVGREVRYAQFDLPEYQYRMTMYDKLLRDVFEYPHLKVIDKVKK